MSITAQKKTTVFDWRGYLPEAERPFEEQDELTLLTMCVWGEARGEDLMSQIAVGCTVRNRVWNPRWWGRSWREVIIKPYQYSALNVGDSNREKMKDPLRRDMEGKIWRQCLWAAWGIYHALVEDNTGGATHYHQRDMREYPSWAGALNRVAEIGPFIFYTALRERSG